MRFDLKLSVFSKEFVKIINRQFNKKDLGLRKLTKKNLLELKKVLEDIEVDTVPKNYVLRALQGNIGYGIFLHTEEKPIQKGQVIGPYTGEVVLEAQVDADDGDYAFDLVNDLYLTKKEQAKFSPDKKFGPRRLYDLKVDALKKGNFTRYINHSNKPNVEAFLVYTEAFQFQIVYIAKTTIYPGEQLLVSYEGEKDSYWKPLGITPFPMTSKTFHLNESLDLVFSEN